jgi:simple sugar transport system permease protein
MIPTRLHAGTLLAILAAILVWVLLWRTTIGFRIRAVGLSMAAARRAGIHVKLYGTLAMIISGALAGLAGAVQVLGVSHRMFTDGTATGFTGGAGFNGIVAALFGQLHPLGTIPASFFFGSLIVGANQMQRAVQVSSSLIVVLNGLLVIFVVSSEIFRKRIARKREMMELEKSIAKPVEEQKEPA